MKKLDSITRLLAKNNLLKSLNKNSGQLHALNQALHHMLPLALIPQCHLATINQNTVVLHADNAAIATQLRFQAETICTALSAKTKTTLSHLTVKVRPPKSTRPLSESPKRQMTISAKNGVLLNDLAMSTDDLELKAALQRLAARANTSN